MVLIGLLLVALACLVVGLLMANAAWLIGSLVASAAAGYLLFRQREQIAARTGVHKNQSAPKGAEQVRSRPQSLVTGTAFTASTSAAAGDPAADPAADTAAPTAAAPTAAAPEAPARRPDPDEPVWVVDTLPLFHAKDCAAILNLAAEPIPRSQAVGDGFTECPVCAPTRSSSAAAQVWVVDGRPDYHLEDCRSLTIAATQQGSAGLPIPRAQAVEDGFSPCPDCDPDGASATAAPAGQSAERDSAPAPDPASDPAPAAPAAAAEQSERTVWVVDGRPRYHLAGCMIIKDQHAEEIPLAQATEDGFMACSLCEPATSRV